MHFYALILIDSLVFIFFFDLKVLKSFSCIYIYVDLFLIFLNRFFQKHITCCFQISFLDNIKPGHLIQKKVNRSSLANIFLQIYSQSNFSFDNLVVLKHCFCCLFYRALYFKIHNHTSFVY